MVTIGLEKGKKLTQPFSKRQILDASKLNDFADNNFKFDENGRLFSKKARKYCRK